MSLKNKYKVVKKVTGFPEVGKLYSNSQTFDDKTFIMKRTGCIGNNIFFTYVDGVNNDTMVINGDNMWEVEIIPVPESEKNINKTPKDWTIDLSFFPRIKVINNPLDVNEQPDSPTSNTDSTELTFPCDMRVSDNNEDFFERTIVAYLGDKFQYPWIACKYSHSENAQQFDGYRYATKLINNDNTTPDDFVYLSLQDISDGKGTGIDPYLIKIKE
jgi:hypothetical protein